MTLKTKYATEMNYDCPHDYYPRPQLQRDSFLCLNGKWELEIIDNTQGKTHKSEVLVPFCPESALSGVERIIMPRELMHYRRKFTLPDGFVQGRVILHFGAVDQECSVYINGTPVGESKGGYIPFSLDITEQLTQGENELVAVVKDSLDKKYPFGKQKYKNGGMWYTPVSGIWQSVWLESTPDEYVESLRITPTDRGVRIKVIGGCESKRLTLDSGECYEFSGDEISIEPKELKLWSPEEPNLYYFTLECGKDTVRSYFAVRYLQIKEYNGVQRICLNGKPYVFNGLLDQGYYPDGLFMPATVDGYIDDIKRVKSMGFNMLRKHIKIEPLIFYYLCDTIGIAVFQDMVNNGGYHFLTETALPPLGMQRMNDTHRYRSREAREIFEDAMYKTAELLYNCPSVVYYTIFNEGWGQFCADIMYDKLRATDATRIIDSTSGWFRQHRSDVDSRHIYFKSLNPKKLDGRPMVISEFGGYSLPVKEHMYSTKSYGYRSFTEQSDFEDALVRLYENEVLPLVEKGASAFVYTQVSDVEEEINGLITYDRKVIKVDSNRLKKTMAKITASN